MERVTTTAGSPRQRRPGELVFLGVALAFSGLALWQAFAISGFASLVSAGVFPMLAASMMVLSAAWLVVQSVRAPAPDTDTGSVARRFVREVLPLRHVSMIALVLAYVLALPKLGFLAASGLFLLVSIALLWRRGWLPALLISAVSLAAVYGLFRVLFQVVLPQGSWWQ